MIINKYLAFMLNLLQKTHHQCVDHTLALIHQASVGVGVQNIRLHAEPKQIWN